jgi:uncharacterized repeat protein (TIGR02543 family)
MKPAQIISRTNPINVVRFIMIMAMASLLIFACPAPTSGGGSGGGTTVATPSFVTASGTILEQDTATIAITCATAGAAIHYTIDGSTPTGASPTYSAAIAASLFNIPTGNGTGEVKAMATLSGSTDSAVVTATYPVQDTRAPIPVISSATTGVNDDFQITVTFDEDVTGFTGTVLNLPAIAYDTIATVSGSVYTIWIRHDTFSVGNIVFNVPAGVCSDSSGNTNAVSSPDFSIFYDPNAPQAVITSAAADPTNAAPIHIAISFGTINVTGFDASDLAPLVNCSITNFTAIDQAHYEADAVPVGQGSVTVDIAGNVCQSQATSAWNIASAQFSRVYDSVAPSLSSVTPATGGYATSSPVTITVDWSEAVTGFTSADIANPLNCSISNFTAVSGSQYTFDLTPSSEAAFSFDIAVGACADLAGNSSTGSIVWSKTYYSSVPTISSIVPATSGYYTATPLLVTIVWNENVTGFDAADIGGLTNCAVSNFTALDPTTYTFNLTPSAQGAFGFTVAAGACANIAGTASTGPVSWTKTFDSLPPSVSTVTPASGGFSATSPVNVEVDWTEAVSGFTSGDIDTLVNCSVSNFTQVTPSQYTFDLTPSSEAAFSFAIDTGICADLAGNPSTGTTAWSMTYSASMPQISSLSPVNGGSWYTVSVPFTIDWDKTVTGFDATDIGTLANCTVSNFTAVSGTQYTFTLTPTAQGSFGFTIPAGACVDLASNLSAGPVAWSRTYDSVAPTVSSVTPATGGYTATSPLTVTVTWNEAVSGFNSADIGSLTNCSVSNFTAVSGSQYSFDLTPASQAAFGFQIDPSACADLAGNASTGTTAWSKTYHTTTPSISNINPVSGGYWTGLSAVPVTITWNEDVTGFTSADIGTLVNSTVSNFTATDAAHYTFDLTPSGQGSFGFTVAAGACVDIASNSSNGPVSWNRTYDTTAPTVSSVSPASGGYTGTSPLTVSVYWTESVTGLTSGDITSLTNCTLSNFTAVSGSQYSFDLTPLSEAAFGFQIDPSVCADAAGNASSGTTNWSKTYHTTIPAITSVTPATGGYATALPVAMTINWNENVSGFISADIGTLVNGTVSNWVAVSGSQYTFDFTPSTQGVFGFTVPASAVTDIAGNPSAASTGWSKTFDSIAPSVSLVTPASGGYTATTPVNVEVDWTEAVSGFASGDITSLVNCTIGNFVQVAPDQYTFDVTPSSQAVFSFAIASGVCADAAGNTSTGATAWSMTYSASNPYITAITPATSGYVTSSPVSMTIDWDKAVTGFDATDIGTLINCTVSNFTPVTQAQYTLSLTPTAQGNFGFTIAAAACTDLALNPSSGPVAWNRTYDSIAPTVSTITPATGGYTGTSPLSVQVDWSESVSGFNSGDIGTLINCAVSNFATVSASRYTFDLTPGSEAAFGFTISPSACADTAGNASTGTTAWSKTYHTTIPSISGITPTSTGYWTGAAVPMTIDWTESVTGFDSSDLGSRVNCSVSNWVAISGSQYTFDLTPSAQGAFGFTIAASACQDVAGNPSTGPVSWTRTFDSAPPTVLSLSPATGGSTTSSPINMTVNWSESVSGFTSGDIGSLTNCAVSNWVAVSGSQYTFDLTPAAEGTFSFQIAPSACADTAGNASTGTTDWSKIYTALHTVTYNGNTNTGGTAPTDGNTYIAGNSVTVLGNTGSLTKTGNSFIGWCVNADGSGTSYIPTNTFAMGTSNVTLYAHWSPLPTYNVTYAGNGNTGGSVPVDGTSYIVGSNVTVMGNTGSLVKAGSTFTGWDDLAASAFYTPGNQFVIDGNITLTAHWTVNPTYTVTYFGNTSTGGTVPVDSTSYENGALVTVMANTGNLVKTGNYFTGWNTLANGSGTAYNGGNTFNMGSANVSLYAQWTANPTYTVTYNGNSSTGGSAPTDSGNYTTGATVTVLGNTGSLVRTGYAFTGWNTLANGSGTSYNPAQTFLMGSANVTLYALWALDSASSWTDLHSASLVYAAYDAVATSADGVYVVAVINGGAGTASGIYTSSNSGTSWTRTHTTSRAFRCVAMSSTGQYVVAGVSTGFLYVSTDYGVTWTQRGTSQPWRGVTMSADGTKMYALANAGTAGVYTSINFGTTWTTANATSRAYYAAHVSSDGTTLAAIVNNGGVYTSTNSGTTMTLKLSMAAAWRGVYISDNGQIITAVVQAGTYPNSGVWVCNDPTKTFTTWTQTDTNSVSYRCIAMSSDGSKMGVGIKGTTGGYISFSSNYGVNWYSRTYTGMLVWTGIAASSTGARFYVTNSSGGSGGSVWVYTQ